ncbi:MAG TPA: DUF3368 domain-containing protein [Thermoflexia bacterium]|nr:DUF3368 domain-containing protein [Thermoflexia bacterium]
MKYLVCDTGPLIALAKVGQLALLPKMCEKVYIPPAVQRELLRKSGPEIVWLEAALGTFIEIVPLPPSPPEVEVVTWQLDCGEQQAIALAYHLQAMVVIDERLGRNAARQLALLMTGSVGLLLRAKECGLITKVVPLLKNMRRQGYWFSDELLALAARLSGE